MISRRMRTHQRLQHIILPAAALLLITVTTPVSADTAITWRLGNPVTESDPFTDVLRTYADTVASESNGRMQFELIEINTIGFKSADSLRVLRQNVVEAMFVFPQYVSRDEPLLGAMMPQGGLPDIEDNLKIIDIQEEIAGEVLSRWDFVPVTRLIDARSSRIGIVSTDPIHTLSDLRTRKLRHFNKEGIRAFNRLGVSTQYIPSHELFLALRMGIVDAAVYTPSYIRSQGLYDVACCYTEIGYYTLASPAMVVVRKEDWQSLADDLKRVMKQAGQRLYLRTLHAAMSGIEVERVEQWLARQGMRILPPLPEDDRRKIQRALLQSWAEKCEELGPEAMRNRQRILDALARANGNEHRRQAW